MSNASPILPDVLPLNHGNSRSVLEDSSGVNVAHTMPDGNSANPAAGGSRAAMNKHVGKQSFASLFKDNRAPVQNSILKYIEPPLGEVVIGCDEIETVETAFGFCLIGYVMGPRPSALSLLSFVKRWDGNVKFVFKENGWIKFQFASELQRDSVLNGGPYLISGRQLFLKKMPSCFLYSKDDMMTLPSWIQIFGLPADCWTVPALSKIASVVGKPIHTDQLTISKKGSTYARVLVEIDAKKDRVWECPVMLPTGKMTVVKFKYELDPKFCGKCNSLGHTIDLCGVDNRKRAAAQKMKQHENNYRAAPNAGLVNEDGSMEKMATEHLEQPDCSHNTDLFPPTHAAGAQQAAVTEGTSNIGEMAAETVSPPLAVLHHDQHGKKSTDVTSPRGIDNASDYHNAGKQPLEEFGDDDLLYSDDFEFPLPRGGGFVSDEDDSDDILSCVRTKDQDEWKKVSKKKHRRFEKKAKPTAKISHHSSGASSMETEGILIDPKNNQPLKGGNSRVFGKVKEEARRPNTASSR